MIEPGAESQPSFSALVAEARYIRPVPRLQRPWSYSHIPAMQRRCGLHPHRTTLPFATTFARLVRICQQRPAPTPPVQP